MIDDGYTTYTYIIEGSSKLKATSKTMSRLFWSTSTSATTSSKSILPLALAGVVATGCVVLFYKVQQLRWRKKQLPFADIPYTVPHPHWLFGHVRYLGAANVVEGLRQLTVEYAGGDVRACTFYSLNTPCFSTLDARLVQRILKFASARTNNRFTRNHFTRLFGNTSIIMLNGKEWKTSRDILQRAFVHSALPGLQQSLWEASLRLEESLRTAVVRKEESTSKSAVLRIDAVELSRMAALDVFGLSSLGYDFGCTKNSHLRRSRVFEQLSFMQSEVTRRCFRQRISLGAQLYWIPTSANRRLKRENRELRNIILQVIRKRKKEMTESDSDNRQDLLSSVLRGSRGFQELSEGFLSDWLVTSIFGGYDTTSLAIAYSLFLLAKYPSYQKECAQEVERVVGSESGSLEKMGIDASKSFPFLNACITEALRYYPPTAVTARSLHKSMDIEIDGKKVTLPKGARCVFSLYWIHHAEINFPRPNEFLPERWAQKNSDGTWEERSPDNDLGHGVPVGNRSANVAFSAGARNCVGQPLAVRMLPTILAVLLRSFDFEVADKSLLTTDLRLERYGGSQTPVGDIPVLVRRRNKSACS